MSSEKSDNDLDSQISSKIVAYLGCFFFYVFFLFGVIHLFNYKNDSFFRPVSQLFLFKIYSNQYLPYVFSCVSFGLLCIAKVWQKNKLLYFSKFVIVVFLCMMFALELYLTIRVTMPHLF